MKLSIIEEKKLDPKSLLPTSLLEEKLYNPFLRTGDSYIQNVLESQDQLKCFKKLCKIRDHYYEDSSK